ncbi:hypothetical protein A0H76_738 [Hepatospora eriocheir]|uniref:Uncharacterized protein n=2 Tax=Hepatospora eriocheir TaxID=1081669 RepID=A0A1X0QL12_9MICR|nr:hypothetical protein A0H76_738 [Hepatospora eriocheir]
MEFSLHYKREISLKYIFFIVKVVLSGFIFELSINRIEAFPLLINTPLILYNIFVNNMFGLYLLVESLINKNLYQLYIHNILLGIETGTIIYLFVLVIVLSNAAELFVLTLIYLVINLFELYLYVKIFKSLTPEFSLDTYRSIGPSNKLLNSYKYREQLKVIAKLLILLVIQGFYLPFRTDEFNLFLMLEISQLIVKVVDIIPIIYFPYKEYLAVKFIQFFDCIYSIGITIVYIALISTNVGVSNQFK